MIKSTPTLEAFTLTPESTAIVKAESERLRKLREARSAPQKPNPDFVETEPAQLGPLS